MKNGTLIASTDLRDFAKSRGWVLLPEALQDRLYVLSHPRFDRRQLVFPVDASAPDYGEAVQLAAEKLAALENQPLETLLRALHGINDDTLSFRLRDHKGDGRTLPLTFAGSVISGAQQLFLAAASTVLKPQVHHPRLSRSEAQQLVEAAQFRHTEAGSFVVNVSCPVHALDLSPPLLPDELSAPFVRRTTLTIRRALRQLVTAIEADTLEQLVEEVREASAPLVSSNLCEAVTRFGDEALRNSLEVEFTWASSLPTPGEETRGAGIQFQWDYFPRVEELRHALRASGSHQEGTFVGTVEALYGEMNFQKRRSGEVILALLLHDGETVRARTVLTADQYAVADEVHMRDGAFVKVSGRLQPGRQPRQLTGVTTFERIGS